ncbi:M23 family metallopeptidase [Allorhizocola rhizosphaerae]|uniref:M23 family metallopeptidase n=1 Tax=Allorhizocola rhizosphaerae TaxID=1872709 RepID=UPI000E3DB9B0|nr:peptidoglycan DD-metalloendopeptidase family protein [Allorhizocola rhizosphaerae]
MNATLAVTLLAAGLFVAPARAGASPPVEPAVVRAVGERTGLYVGRVEVQRSEGEWAFGVVLQSAKPGDYARGWLFLARLESSEWTVALDSTSPFARLAGKAPDSVLGPAEKQIFMAREDMMIQAGNNTELGLPYAVGATWTMTGGPHGWAGTDTPYSSLDLSGGDHVVRAAGAGTVYTMCADSSNGGTPGGWRRVYHANGYTTDYYHLWNLTGLGNGASIGAGTALGNTGTNLCGGGSASGRHVHWGILSGTTRVAWHWRSAGKWVFWQGAAYGGYALHGSTQRNVGTGLYNYGPLGGNQGIVDSNGGGTVNRRGGPGTGYPIVGTLNDGDTVTISCWRNGTTHTGRWGATAVWNRLPDGTWFSDAFAYTGVNTIGPNC